MRNILDKLAADYSRSRIENVTLLLVPAMLAVVGFAAAVSP